MIWTKCSVAENLFVIEHRNRFVLKTLLVVSSPQWPPVIYMHICESTIKKKPRRCPRHRHTTKHSNICVKLFYLQKQNGTKWKEGSHIHADRWSVSLVLPHHRSTFPGPGQNFNLCVQSVFPSLNIKFHYLFPVLCFPVLKRIFQHTGHKDWSLLKGCPHILHDLSLSSHVFHDNFGLREETVLLTEVKMHGTPQIQCKLSTLHFKLKQ